MKIRRLVLDVDKARERPTLIEIIQALEKISNIQAINITVDNIDIETVGTVVTIEGEKLDYDDIVNAIEHSGAVVHSVDQIVSGDRIIEHIPRVRGGK